jgi:hypothetical protein
MGYYREPHRFKRRDGFTVGWVLLPAERQLVESVHFIGSKGTGWWILNDNLLWMRLKECPPADRVLFSSDDVAGSGKDLLVSRYLLEGRDPHHV